MTVRLPFSCCKTVEYLMNRLRLTANSSKSWRTSLKTAINKLALALPLVLALVLLTGASSFFAQDNAGILTKDTRQIKRTARILNAAAKRKTISQVFSLNFVFMFFPVSRKFKASPNFPTLHIQINKNM